MERAGSWMKGSKAWWRKTRGERSRGAGEDALVGLHPGRLDDRPPLVDLGLVVRRERGGRLLLGLWDFLAQVAQSLANRRVRQGLHEGGVELRDDGLGRAPGGPRPV